MVKKTKRNSNFLNDSWWETATVDDVLKEISKGADLECVYDMWIIRSISDNKKHRFEILKALIENGLNLDEVLCSVFQFYPFNEGLYFLEQKDSLNDEIISDLFSQLAFSNMLNQKCVKQLEYLIDCYHDRKLSLNALNSLASVRDKGIVSLFFNKIVLPRKDDLDAIGAIVNGAICNEVLINLLLDKVFVENVPENIFNDTIVFNAENKKLVDKFLKKGIDKNIQDSRGYTILNKLIMEYEEETCYNGEKHKNKVEQFKNKINYWIDYGINVNIPSNDGTTPLLTLCRLTNPPLDIISKLIAKGEDVNEERKDYTNTPLSKLYKVLPTNNDTALYYAVTRSKNIKLINLLLDSGANVNTFSRNDLLSILDAAMKYENDVKIIDMILKSGISDYYKMRGFLRCISNNYSREIFDVFINSGININEKFTGYIDSKWMVVEYTPLMMACHSGNMEYFKLLIDLGADMYVKDDKGRSLLSIACSSVSPDTSFIKYLLSLGFDVNEQDNDGNTPLMLRFMNWDLGKIFKVLMVNGADINKRNYNGDNILLIEECSINYRTDIREVLVKCGADVTVVNNDGKKVDDWSISLYEEKFNTTVDRAKIDKEVARKLREKSKRTIDKNFFQDKVVCFAGFKNKKLSDYICSHGGKYVTSVTDNCNLVIQNNGWLTTKGEVTVSEAVEKVVPIVSLRDIEDKIREYGDIKEIY